MRCLGELVGVNISASAQEPLDRVSLGRRQQAVDLCLGTNERPALHWPRHRTVDHGARRAAPTNICSALASPIIGSRIGARSAPTSQLA